MGINDKNLTIYPYTVGREDCKVLPRSFKTLAEAETCLAEQNKGARDQGEFYLDGPEQDNIAVPSDSCQTVASDHPRVVVTASPVAKRGEAHSECIPLPTEFRLRPGSWRREIEELCRALEAHDKRSSALAD